MQLTVGRKLELTDVVLCSRGLFSEGPDKFGAVTPQRDGDRLDGRTALSLVQTARALAAEYPEEVVAVDPEDDLSAGDFPRATVLEKYLICLTRLDTP